MDVIDKCKDIAKEFRNKALEEVGSFEPPFSKAKFRKLIEFIVSRDK